MGLDLKIIQTHIKKALILRQHVCIRITLLLKMQKLENLYVYCEMMRIQKEFVVFHHRIYTSRMCGKIVFGSLFSEKAALVELNQTNNDYIDGC